MIVEMKNAAILTLAKEKLSVLEKLRHLGVMHIKSSFRKESADASKLENDLKEVEKLLFLFASAKAKGADLVICDTAGRLHNKKNLMNELEKINRIIDRELPGAARENLLVLDATTGQNAILQAKEFKNAANITGLVLNKLDGTAKGGIVISIKQELQIPVKFVGVGEKIDDMQEFDSTEFISALFE